MSNRLTEDDEIMFRHVHPSFVQDGLPSSQPFLPTIKDDNKLSVDRSAFTSAAESFARFTGDGHRSAGVYGLMVGEFKEHGINCISDPMEAGDGRSANIAHAYADYSQFGSNKQKTIAKRLKIQAIARGRLHP